MYILYNYRNIRSISNEITLKAVLNKQIVDRQQCFLVRFAHLKHDFMPE